MAILSGPEIVRQIQLGRITITPFHEDQLNPNSYNLTLGRDLLVYRAPPRWRRARLAMRGTPWCLDMKQDNPHERLEIPPGGLVLRPGRLYLGSTAEYTETKDFVPMIEGRSSVGRLGLYVHVTAGFGETFFRGEWTLELSVIHPLRVYAGTKICQILYSDVVGEVVPYAGKYQGQRGPQSSRLWRELQPYHAATTP